MTTIPLHHHTHASFMDAHGTPAQVAERCLELAMPACAVTDHGNIIAHVPFQKEMRKRGLKPIFGCEFYICNDMTARTRYQENLGVNAIPHITILARTQEGYANLLKLSRLSWVDGFYYKPRVDWDTLYKHQQGLTVLSGCVAGYPSRLLLGEERVVTDDRLNQCYDFLAKVRERIEDFYVELVPEPGLAFAEACMWPLLKIAVALNIPPVLTADGHFVRPEHHRVQDVMLARSTGQRVDEEPRKIQLPEYQFLCSGDQLLQRAMDSTPWVEGMPAPHVIRSAYQLALDNTHSIALRCEVEIPKAKPVTFPGLPEQVSAADQLLMWVTEGFTEREQAGKFIADREVYWARAMREYEMITRKGFADYMLAIIDVVRWMKQQDGLVMLRGSAGGCLLLWLTHASCVDPLKHDLSFERFWDDTRPDPPDVDIDFEQGKRNDAIQYVYNKYGAECCSQIAALSALKAKAALVDACAALGIPRARYAPLATLLDSADSDVAHQLEAIKDPAALRVLEEYPELRQLVPLMIGQFRQASKHAAGVLISSEPLDRVIGVMLGADKQPVASVDKKGAAELGFLKMDFLSVSALDVLANTARRVWGTVAPLYDLPLDDPAALRLANAGYLAGVFQLDGGSAARVSRQIGLHSFEDIVAASALCRPGPADWVQTYKANKADPAGFAQYLQQFHPTAAKVIAPTYGILLFQEQVMNLARDLAQFDMPHVHKLRKGVTDKLGLDPQKGDAWRQEWSSRFAIGCIGNGVSGPEAAHWWESISTHGGYSFNAAHCTSYGYLGAWMLYLKAHHPSEFYATYLEFEQEDTKRARLIREFLRLDKAHSVDLLDPEHLSVSFQAVGPHRIIGGLQQLRGVGPKTALKIAEKCGTSTGWEELYATLPTATSDLLQQCGAQDSDWRLQPLIELAPWCPVFALEPHHYALRAEHGILMIGNFLREYAGEKTSDVVLCGYVKGLDFEHGRIGLMLEDETGVVLVRVPSHSISNCLPLFTKLKPGDFLVVSGFWSGDTLYVKSYIPNGDALNADREWRKENLPQPTSYKAVKKSASGKRGRAKSGGVDADDGQQLAAGEKRKRSKRFTGDSARVVPTLPPLLEGRGAGGGSQGRGQVGSNGDSSALGGGADAAGSVEPAL